MEKKKEKMRLDSILNGMVECRCGQTHRVPVKSIVYTEDAHNELADFLAKQIRGRSVAIASDLRTHAISGLSLENLLQGAGWSVQAIVLPDPADASPVCDDRTFNALLSEIDKSVNVLVAVGSGVVNDLTKWVSFEMEKPYVVVPTAASMNGYTAANVAPTINGVKSLVRAHAPLGVFARPSVIEQAPFRLTASGLGDAVAKSVSVADWELNHAIIDEHFCPFCADMINDIESFYFDHPEVVAQKSAKGIKAVFDALIYSGLAMTMIGTSAPASGGEHLFSHTLDMMSLVDKSDHDLHGRQVGLGTLFSAALYSRLRRIHRPVFREMPQTIDRPFWGNLAESVESQYQVKLDKIPQIRERLKAPGTWKSIQENVFIKVKSPDRIARCLKAAGAARYIKDIDCTRARAREAIMHLHEIRSRFTVVDLAWLVGILPESVDEIIDEWLMDGA